MKFVPKKLEETADISKGRSTPGDLIKNILGVVIIFFGLYLALGLVADLVASNISEETEATWFSWTAEGENSRDDLADSPDFIRASEIFERLVSEGSLRPLPYKLHGHKMLDINAFALPGGAVFITRGLLAEVKSEKGMAMVLAHELGHHQHRHCLEGLGRSVLIWCAKSILFGVNIMSVQAEDTFLDLTEAGYSRRKESEADEFGMRLVQSIYGDTSGCLEFYELIERKHREGESRWSQFHRSHPLTTDRIKHLKELQEELAAENP